jgi:hypothetical protein
MPGTVARGGETHLLKVGLACKAEGAGEVPIVVDDIPLPDLRD